MNSAESEGKGVCCYSVKYHNLCELNIDNECREKVMNIENN